MHAVLTGPATLTVYRDACDKAIYTDSLFWKRLSEYLANHGMPLIRAVSVCAQ